MIGPTRELLIRANAGNTYAQCKVAQIFMSEETSRGYRQAIPWLRRAARRGHRWAEYHLGLIYDHGLAGQRDRRVAARWYERAASQGYSSAQLNLGIILANRPARHRNLRRAVQLYRLAARQGRRNAAYNLGLYYSEGRSVRRNLAAARRWYRMASDLGDHDARRILRTLGRAANNEFQQTAPGVTPLATRLRPTSPRKVARKGRATRPAAELGRYAGSP